MVSISQRSLENYKKTQERKGWSYEAQIPKVKKRKSQKIFKKKKAKKLKKEINKKKKKVKKKRNKQKKQESKKKKVEFIQ